MLFRNFSSVSYFRNFVFGVEDSLVSTVGLLSDIAVYVCSGSVRSGNGRSQTIRD